MNESLTNVLFLILTVLFLVLILLISHPEPEFCDYDSCSQESYKWNYSGSPCFDSNNSDCKDFLRFWNACQEHKRRMGVC